MSVNSKKEEVHCFIFYLSSAFAERHCLGLGLGLGSVALAWSVLALLTSLFGSTHVGKGKGRVLAIAPLTQGRLATRSAFTISEVAADWHELMIPQRTICGHPLPASANNWTRDCS